MSKARDPTSRPTPRAAESDPRFPSGKWKGFWLQSPSPQRQPMSLDLHFADGKVAGHGSDGVGDFDLQGFYDLTDGSVSLIKQYLGAHDVHYDGRNEDDGQWIWGVWTIRSFDRGGFHLWPAGEDDPTQPKLKRSRERPLERKRERKLILTP